VAEEYQKYYAKLLEMLERVGDVLPRYSTYSSMFCKHTRLQDVLSLAYFHIITFLMDAKRMFSKQSFRLLSRVLWKSFDSDFETSIEKLRRYRKFVEDEARLASMVESQAERREAAEDRKRMQQKRNSAAESRGTLKVINDTIGGREQGNSLSLQR
jgi:hypothetical protein